MFNGYNFNEGVFNAGIARLEGASQLVVTTYGGLNLDLLGTSTVIVTGSATAALGKQLQGTSELAVTGSGELQNFVYVSPYAFNGAAFNVYTVNAPDTQILAGSASAVVTTAAVVRVGKALVGSALGVVTCSAPGVSGTNKLAGSSSGVVSASAVLRDEQKLFGSAAAAATAAAVLRKGVEFVGSATGVVVGSGEVARSPMVEIFVGAYTPDETLATYEYDDVQVEALADDVLMEIDTGEIYANATY